MQPLDSSSLYLPEELAAKIAKALAPDLRPAGATEGFNPYEQVCLQEIENHLGKISTVLRSIVDEWEAMMGADDKSLYSLGLRHAIDVMYGRNITPQS